TGPTAGADSWSVAIPDSASLMRTSSFSLLDIPERTIERRAGYDTAANHFCLVLIYKEFLLGILGNTRHTRLG
ncbi:MAG: hypothetical protein OEM60_15945, partial [Gammaproteobacteria bacterium]|nr:hypothetical protein [Gammaproteobacteria bacterium]